MKQLLVVVFLAMLLFSCAPRQEKMELLTEDYPPLTFAIGDSVTGFATEVVREMEYQMRVRNPIYLMDWDEAYNKALSTPNVVIFTIEKTPAREDKFHWIGPLGKNITSFYVRSDTTTTIASLDEAKKLKAIATTTDWFTEQHLKDSGFTNLVSSANPSDNIRQVMDGSVSATILTDITSKSIITKAGFNPSDLKPVLNVLETEYYIGISKATSQKIVDKWRKAFDEIKADGSINDLKKRWMLE
jgi:polar amino acid transport system substrate-binding protein